MTNVHTLSILKQTLGAGDQAAHARFLDAVGDFTIRPSNLRSTYPIKTLLWRFNDLKPHVREGLEAELRDRWQVFTSEDLKAADRGAQSNPTPPARPEAVSPTPERSERNAFLPAVAPTPERSERNAFLPAVARREDAFDRFLGWLACLLGR